MTTAILLAALAVGADWNMIDRPDWNMSPDIQAHAILPLFEAAVVPAAEACPPGST
jgi:hypothetical protein